jgi:hypothetical protein
MVTPPIKEFANVLVNADRSLSRATADLVNALDGPAGSNEAVAEALPGAAKRIAGAVELLGQGHGMSAMSDAMKSSPSAQLSLEALKQAVQAQQLLHAGDARGGVDALEIARGKIEAAVTDATRGVQNHADESTARFLSRGPSGFQTHSDIVGTLPSSHVGKRRIALGEEDMVKVRRRVHENLGTIFAQISDDMHQVLKGYEDLPLDRIPRAGEEPKLTRYAGSIADRWSELRKDVAGDDELFKRADKVVESRQQIPGEEHIHGLDIVVPVGAYGPEMAIALTEAARVMHAVGIDQLRANADALTYQHYRTIMDWTFQEDVLKALLEGNGTFSGTAGILAHRKVPGMDGEQLLDAIQVSSLFDRGAKGPLGVVGPMFFNGILPKNSVEDAANGKLKLAKEFDQIVKATRNGRKDDLVSSPQTRQTHKGCPVAVRSLAVEREDGQYVKTETFITTLGRDYIKLAKRFYRAELAKKEDAAG